MSEWGAWSQCSKTCGPGSQTGSRNVAQNPLNGGTSCPSETTMTRDCNENPCKGVYTIRI